MCLFDWKLIEEKVNLAFKSIPCILLFSERIHQMHNSVNISAMKLSQGGTEIRRILLLPVQLNTNYEYHLLQYKTNGTEPNNTTNALELIFFGNHIVPIGLYKS